jgi:DNA polymerase-3 subunit epsilon
MVNDMILTVFDTETTGLDPDKHEILEAALLSLILDADGNYYVLKEREFKIKPEQLHLASSKALEINGYTDEAWKDARPFSEVMEEMRPIIEESDVFLGQNLIFDMRFVDECCRRHSVKCPEFPAYIDTKEMADKLVRSDWLKRSGMDYLVEHYAVQVEGRAHTALVDCWRTFKVWEKLLKDCGEEYNLHTFDEPYQSYRRR